MDLLLAFLLLAVWILTINDAKEKFKAWRIRKSERPHKRRLWPLKRAVRPDEPKRRISYRPPNKDA